MLSEHFNLDFLKHKFKSWDACEREMQVSKLNKGKNSTCGGWSWGQRLLHLFSVHSNFRHLCNLLKCVFYVIFYFLDKNDASVTTCKIKWGISLHVLVIYSILKKCYWLVIENSSSRKNSKISTSYLEFLHLQTKSTRRDHWKYLVYLFW